MKRYLWLFFFLILAFWVYWKLSIDFKKDGPILFTNGTILTMNPNQPKASHLFVSNGEVVSVGGEEVLETIAVENINILDLEGNILMPGFIDPHTHAGLSLIFSNTIDLSGFTHANNETIWAHFEKATKNAPPGEVLIGMGLDPILTPDLVLPTKAYLDEMAPNNPVIIFSQSLHNYWANSLAFEKAGLANQTPDPSKHSYYGHDESGDLDGLIVEQEAFIPFLPLVKENLNKAPLADNAIEVLKGYARNGNTTIVTAGMTMEEEKTLLLWEHLSSETPTIIGQLLAWAGQLPNRQAVPRHFIYLRHDMATTLPESHKHVGEAYGLIGVKHWYDGSPYIGSMYLDSAYNTTNLTKNKLYIEPGTRGEALIEYKALTRFIRKYHSKGWQIAIHTQGNAAIREVLDAFEALEGELDYSKSRHRLEHCLMLDSLQISRMKRLNITPSFHVNHIAYYGDGLKSDLLGETRAEALLPIASTAEAGIRFTLHADQPMFESNPFRLIQTAVERKTRRGDILGEAERISKMQAIKALTVDAAWQIGREDQLGSIEVGKMADLIILDKNPFNTPDSLIHTINVLETFVGGNKITF